MQDWPSIFNLSLKAREGVETVRFMVQRLTVPETTGISGLGTFVQSFSEQQNAHSTPFEHASFARQTLLDFERSIRIKDAFTDFITENHVRMLRLLASLPKLKKITLGEPDFWSAEFDVEAQSQGISMQRLGSTGDRIVSNQLWELFVRTSWLKPSLKLQLSFIDSRSPVLDSISMNMLHIRHLQHFHLGLCFRGHDDSPVTFFYFLKRMLQSMPWLRSLSLSGTHINSERIDEQPLDHESTTIILQDLYLPNLGVLALKRWEVALEDLWEVCNIHTLLHTCIITPLDIHAEGLPESEEAITAFMARVHGGMPLLTVWNYETRRMIR